MKSLFRGIKPFVLILQVITMVIWASLNVCFVEKLSDLTVLAADNQYSLTKLILEYVILLVSWEVSEYIGDLYDNVANTYIENDTNYYYFMKASVTKPEVLKRANTGYLTGLVNSLVGKRETAYNHCMISGFITIFYIIYCIVRMTIFHWKFGVILFFLIVLGISLRIVGNAVSAKDADLLTELESKRVKLSVDFISNISTLQKMRAEKFAESKLLAINEECLKQTYKWGMCDEFFFASYKLVIFSYVPICLFVISMYPHLLSDNKVKFYSLLALIGVQLVHNAKNVSVVLKRFKLFKIAEKKLDKILCDDNKISGSYISDFEKAEIKDATYSYIHDHTKRSVTVNIPYFCIQKGDKVCIVGESGQGKTTTLNILSGQLDTNFVYIDGERTNDRLECVFISQDTEMLDMSIRDNLKLGNENISDEEIIELFKCVGLYDWFLLQEKGLDTLLGERGVFVSTGQRQRLNLIRGLLIKDKDVYMLDEPTSNVDDETEVKIINLLEERLKDKTVLIVSHRPRIKEICNREYEFVGGMMYERR